MPHRRKETSKIYIRVGGVRRSAGTEDWEAATALEHKLNHELWLQRQMGTAAKHSWKKAVVQWCKERAHKATLSEDITKFGWFDQYLGQVDDINTITRSMIDQIIQTREGVSVSKPTSANATANKYVALVSAVLNAAENEWEWGMRAPKLRRYPKPDGEQRWLTVEEWAELRKHMADHLRLAATFALATGLREAKQFGLTWPQLRLVNRSFTFSGTANKLGNTIPLNAIAMQVLEEIRQGSVLHAMNVFTYRGQPMLNHNTTAWAAAFRRSGVPYMKWHGLRHTFNSWLAQKGVPKEIRKRLMGHQTQDVHDDYTHLDIEHLRPYSATIDTILGGTEVRATLVAK